jgi:sugar (glycoside-pentoside-hexuronide) transporter
MNDKSTRSKLNLKEVFSYSAGNFGLNLFFASISTYLLYFYTDNFGMSAAAAGSLILSAKLINIVANPLIGIMVDRTKGRWGKFRPYFLFGSVPLAAIGILTFTVPDLGPSGKLIYAYVTYFLFNVLYSLVNVPYSSTLAAMSDDYITRSRISSVKVFIGQFGGLIVTSATLPLVHLFSTETLGFKMVFSVYGAVLILMLLITFWGTKGVGHQSAQVQKGKPSSEMTIANQLKTVVYNKYLLLLLVFILVYQLAQSTGSGAALFFFKYNLGKANLFSLYSLIGFSVLMCGVLINPLLVKKVGKRNVGIISLIVLILSFIGFYLNSTDVTMVFVFGALSYLGLGLMAPLPWSMVPDTIEYGHWKIGLRSEGTIYSAFIFVQLLATAIGAKLTGAILSAYGYVPNVEQSAASLQGILILVTIVPIIGAAIGIVVLLLYKLDEKTFKRYVKEIEERESGGHTRSSDATLDHSA